MKLTGPVPSTRLTIKIVSELIEEGPQASSGDRVKYSARFFLRRGDEVTSDFESIAKYGDRVPTREVEGVLLVEHTTRLGKRQSISGIERALEGLSAGSFREVIIPPQLAYGTKGSGKIPPNAILRAKLWLHEVIVADFTSHDYRRQ